MELQYAKGDFVDFKYEESSVTHRVMITRVDTTDASLPYYGTDDRGETFWFSEDAITTRVSTAPRDQMNRIEAKLDAIIKHFNVPFEN